MGKYQVSSTSNSLKAVVEGAFTPADAAGYVDAFKKEVAKINPKTCKLTVDASNLAISGADMAEVLKNILKLYSDTGFHKVEFLAGSNTVLKMQLRRLSNSTSLEVNII
ncbi:MAG: hypothetical protein H6Q60_1366 [Oscillospiraceae bacterium]|nr:hypothetical protein [Oscillospiraceae bacterium]